MSKQQPTVSFYLSQVLDNIGEAVIVTNLSYSIIRFNKAAEEIYGWDSEDVMGKRITDIIPIRYFDKTPEEVEEAFDKNDVWKGEVIQKTKDGKEIFVATNVVRFANSEGKAIGIVAINRDITAQKQTQIAVKRSEALWRAFANALPDIAFIFDTNGKYVQILNIHEDLLYNKSGKLLNSYVEDVLPSEIAEHFMLAIHNTLATGESQTLEYLLPLQKGDTWFEAHTSCFQPNPESEPMVIWLARDISDRREAEQQRLNFELLQLKFQNEHEINLLRSQLLTTISHEFRTPLAVIQTSAYMLHRYKMKLDEEEQKEHFNAIHKQVDHLREMLDNVTRTIEIMNQDFHFEPYLLDIEDFVFETIIPLIAEKDVERITFDIQVVKKVYIDKWTLELILSHLLNNALRYSPEESIVYCFIDSDDRDLIIRISDTGIGIPQNELNQIFEPHFRCSNTGDIRGMGLGLSLVQNLVSRLEGQIYVDSKVDQGSNFTVLLPHLDYAQSNSHKR